MKINFKRYKPPKPFYKMSIDELVKYNKRCILLDNLYFKKGKKRNKRVTRNKKNRKTKKRKKRTRKSLQILNIEL